jgi:CubicO group peptidase (beta-lactamase class C family)
MSTIIRTLHQLRWIHVIAVVGFVVGIAHGGDLLPPSAREPGVSGPADRRNSEAHLIEFDQEVRAFAKLLDLPGMVVVVACDGEVIHKVEIGYANTESKTSITANHMFWLASVTKTFAATLIMQMVDEGVVSLDDRMIDHWLPSFFPGRISPDVRLRHVLGHTSQGTPGKTFVYNGGRFGFVYGVFEKAGTPLRDRLVQRILVPLHMDSTLPGIGDAELQNLRDRLVTPYRYDSALHRHVEAPDVLKMGDLYASTGVASSALDLVRYARALDRHELLSAKAHAAMTAPAVSTDGRSLPYGVGWFTQSFCGEGFVWHYGYGPADSAILLRLPRQKLTLVVLANSDQLSASALLGNGNALNSPLVVSFFKHFVVRNQEAWPAVDYNAPSTEVEQRLGAIRDPAALDVVGAEVFAQALTRDYLARRDSREDMKPERLLRWLLKLAPVRLRDDDLTLMELLSQQTAPDLLRAAEPLVERLVKSQPENPGVLAAGVEYCKRTGKEARALALRRQLAELKGYEDDPRKQEAALSLGNYYVDKDVDAAAAYYWNAMTWWYNSGNGGDLGGRITESLKRLHAAERARP